MSTTTGIQSRRSRYDSERATTYKKKDSGIDKRNLRAHRRSLEWKQSREVEVNMRRKGVVSPLSPLKELHSNVDDTISGPVKALANNADSQPLEPKKTKAQKASDERREMLEKWRKEKELKKKLESQDKAKKKPFKVTHAAPNLIAARRFNDVTKPTPRVAVQKSPVLSKGRKVLPRSPKVTVSAAKRVTRSQVTKPTETRDSKVSTLKKEPKIAEKKKMSKESGRQTTRAATKKPAKSSEAIVDKRKPAHLNIAKDQKVNNITPRGLTRDKSGMLRDTITSFRGSRVSSSEMSFAPSDFKFSAPSNLHSFVFKPLSPASAAGFLLPGNDLSKLTPPSTKRCSTPLSQSKLKSQTSFKQMLVSSGSSGDENTKKDGKNKEKKKSIVTSQTPVMSLASEVEKISESPSNCVEKNNLAHAETQRTPRRWKSVRKSQVPESTSTGKSGSTQSLPEEQLYGSKPLVDDDDTENQPPVNPDSQPSMDTDGHIPDNVFKTPAPCPRTGPKRARTRSLGTALLLSNSAKKFRTPRNNRNSLILSTLSPEEGVKVLQNSPMVELTRRTPKQHTSPAGVKLMVVDAMPSFDDIEEELAAAAANAQHRVQEQSADTGAEEMSSVKQPETTTTSETSQSTIVVDTVTEVLPTTTEENTLPLAQSLQENKLSVPYFRDITVKESKKLQDLCDKWDSVNRSAGNLHEEAQGEIRTAIGKAQLLMAQRFKQFSGLVDNCEFKRGEKETTCTDLEGFWEMIYYQVEDVHNMFADLDKKQANGWQTEKQTDVKVKKKIIKKQPIKSSKPAVRSKFAEFRKKMKQQEETGTTEVLECKSFVSGIIRIESPVKKIVPHCEGGTPNKLSRLVSSQGNTPSGSPLLKAVMERSVKKSRGPSPLVVDSTYPTQSPLAVSGGKRKRKPSSETSTTPAKVSRMECEDVTSNTAAPPSSHLPVIEGKSIFSPDESLQKLSKRRSLRRSIRKSVSWEGVQSGESPLKQNVICADEPETTATILSQFLQPSCIHDPQSDMEVDSPPEDVDMSVLSKRALHSEFDKHSNSAKKGNTPRRRSVRLLSTEKSLSAQRKDRRTVHFSGTNSTQDSPVCLKMPVTPFNKELLVPRTRRSGRQSVGSDCLFSPLRTTGFSPLHDCSTTTTPTPPGHTMPGTDVLEHSASPATRLAQLHMDGTPKERRSSTRNSRRVSGFTPTKKVSPPVSSLHSVMEASDLMSFSPVVNPQDETADNEKEKKSRTQRRSLRPRVSLL